MEDSEFKDTSITKKEKKTRAEINRDYYNRRKAQYQKQRCLQQSIETCKTNAELLKKEKKSRAEINRDAYNRRKAKRLGFTAKNDFILGPDTQTIVQQPERYSEEPNWRTEWLSRRTKWHPTDQNTLCSEYLDINSLDPTISEANPNLLRESATSTTIIKNEREEEIDESILSVNQGPELSIDPLLLPQDQYSTTISTKPIEILESNDIKIEHHDIEAFPDNTDVENSTSFTRIKDSVLYKYQDIISNVIDRIDHSNPDEISNTNRIQTINSTPKQYCRLCAKLCADKFLISLFNHQDGEDYLDLLAIIMPGMITKTDKLPHTICTTCGSKLNYFKFFFKGFLKANAELEKLFNINTNRNELTSLNQPEFNDKIDDKLDLEDSTSEEDTDEETIDEDPYICILCEAKFTKKHALQSHTLQNHTKINKMMEIEESQNSESHKIQKFRHTKEDKRTTIEKLTAVVTIESDLEETTKEVDSEDNADDLIDHDHTVEINHEEDDDDVLTDNESKKKKRKNRKNPNEIKQKAESSCLCSVCGKIFASFKSLRIHQVVHTNERRYRCTLCSKSFKTGGHLAKHRYSHNATRHFMCQICGKQYQSPAGLQKHSFKHSLEKPHYCDLCGAGFLYPAFLRKHRQRHEKDDVHLMNKCRICRLDMASYAALLVHMNVEHAGEKPYACELCNRQFMVKQYLETHKRVHTGERPYKCEICLKMFHSKGWLNQHMITHNKEHMYACNLCPKTFRLIHHLKRHNRTHSRR